MLACACVQRSENSADLLYKCSPIMPEFGLRLVAGDSGPRKLECPTAVLQRLRSRRLWWRHVTWARGGGMGWNASMRGEGAASRRGIRTYSSCAAGTAIWHSITRCVTAEFWSLPGVTPRPVIQQLPFQRTIAHIWWRAGVLCCLVASGWYFVKQDYVLRLMTAPAAFVPSISVQARDL